MVARISPPSSELSPAFMAFCTAFDRISSKIRSKGAYCAVWRLPVRRRKTSRNR
ncbi:hypothetical protein D3C86_2027260 [compost metagenome]